MGWRGVDDTGDDGELEPSELTADTLNWCVRPFDRPDTVAYVVEPGTRADVVHVAASIDCSTTYSMIGAAADVAAAVQLNVTRPSPATAVRPVGALGTVGGAGAKEPVKRRRFGEPVPAFAMTFDVAAANIVEATVAGDAVGFVSRKSAIAPATCGAAIDVPDHVPIDVSLVLVADVMP